MELPFLNDGHMLKGIYQYQYDLMSRYLDMNIIPLWSPKFIDRKEYQAYLRKLISWITDELGEASIEFNMGLQKSLTPEGNPGHAMLSGAHELMDAMHFIIELMIYSDIMYEDIEAYYKELLKERNLDPINFSDGLMTTLAYGRHTNNWDDQVRIVNWQTATMQLNTQVNQDKLVIPFKISEELEALKELCMWDVVKAYSQAARYLKNKEWKVTTIETNVTEYKRALMVAWLYFGKLLDLSSLEARTVYYLYEHINKKNQRRIADGY